MNTVRVGIIMGSRSDHDTMAEAARILDELGVGYEMEVVSAHRTPDRMFAYAEAAEGRGVEAAESLRKDGGITYSRGRIRIADIHQVEAMACECYRATREDFDRLLGGVGRRFVLGAAGPT